MTHHDTKPGQENLSPAQLQVLQGLLSGESVTAAARMGKVSRETVHRWLRADFGFQAAFNQGRREILEEIQDGLLMTARDAAGQVAAAVKSGDVKVALAVLKGVGAFSGRSPQFGSGDPGKLEREADLEVQEEDAKLLDRAILASY